MSTQGLRSPNASAALAAVMVVLLLAGTACNLSTQVVPTPFEEPTVSATSVNTPSPILLRVGALRFSPHSVTFALVLTNLASTDLGRLELSLSAPAGTAPGEVIASPLGANAESTGERTTWVFGKLPALSIAGPFAVTLQIEEDAAPLTASVTWQDPGAGSFSATSSIPQNAAASVAELTAVTGAWTEAPGSGVRAYAPGAGPGRLMIIRHDDPGRPLAGPTLEWLAAFEVSKEHEGSAILEVPLPRPAPPFAVLRIAADHGQGFELAAVYGTVTADGLHAVFAAEGASIFALGIDQARLNDALTELETDLAGSLFSAAQEGLAAFSDAQAMMEDIQALLGSLRTDGVFEEVGWVIWGPLGEALGFGGAGPGDTSGGGSVCTPSVFGNQVCQNESDAVCGGGGSTSINSSDGSRTVYCNDGSSYDCTAGGVCTRRSGFAPVPGPCPWGVCMVDPLSGQVYGMDQVDGLSDLLSDILSRTAGIETDQGPTDLAGLAGAGEHLDASSFVSIVVLIGDTPLVLIPGGQDLELAFGAPSIPPTPPAALGDIPIPTQTPTSTATTAPPAPPAATTVAPIPPTATPTPTSPPPDTSGPSIKSVADAPDPIKVTQPKGCTPTTSTVSAAISDPSGVASAYVLFFHTTIGQVPMSSSGGNTWTATLGPYSGIGDGTADYQIHAVDTLGNASDSSFGQVTVLACIP